MNEPASGKNGRHANYANRRRHERMDESEKPKVEIARHMVEREEYIIRIDHEQLGGPVSAEELDAIHDAIEEM